MGRGLRGSYSGGSGQAGKGMASFAYDFGAGTPDRERNKVPVGITPGLPVRAIGNSSEPIFKIQTRSQTESMPRYKDKWRGKTEVGKSVEPLAGRGELAGIPSPKIRLLFMLHLYLWTGHARSYQSVYNFIHSFHKYLFIELLL